MKISDNDLFRLQDGEPPMIINPDWDIETVITSMAVELLELRSEVEQRWISVKDKLPKMKQEILVYDYDVGIFVDEYNGDLPIWATHWTPLPEPPEEDA